MEVPQMGHKSKPNYGHRHSSSNISELMYLSPPIKGNIPASDIFNSFIYCDHVTLRKYQFFKLKSEDPSHLNRRQCTSFEQNKDQEEHNEQMAQFLDELRMINNIRSNRHQVLSRHQNRKASIQVQGHKKASNPDLLKLNIRKEVDKINHKNLKQYLYQKKPYRPVIGNLNKMSQQGALTLEKIKDIKQAIQECHRKDPDTPKPSSLTIKQREKKLQEVNKYDDYFNSAWTQIKKDIARKVRTDAIYNWEKCGKNQYRDN